jgi:hypothetical protein
MLKIQLKIYSAMAFSLIILSCALPALGGVIVERAPTVSAQFLGTFK